MYRILIADDEADVRDLIAKSINRADLELEVVGCVEDGEEAIKLVHELKPDILITDICMPKVSGLELLQAVKDTGINIKTVIISGYDEFAYARQAMELGVTYYLLKPFLPEEMFEVLRKIRDELDSNASLVKNMEVLKTQFEDNIIFIQEQFLKELLRSKPKINHLIEEGKTIRLELEANYYCTGVLKLQSDSVNNVWNFNNQRKVEEFLILIKDEYFDNNTRTYAVSFHDNQITMIFCSLHTDVLEFYTKIWAGIEKMKQSLLKYYNIKLVGALGRIYSRAEQIYDSYQEAQQAIKIISSSQKSILPYEETKHILAGKNTRTMGVKPQELEDKLILNIRLARREKALAVLEDILQYYENFVLDSPEYVNISIFGMVFSVDNALLESGGSFHIWQDEKIKQYFKDQLNYGTLLDTKLVLEDYISGRCEEFAAIMLRQGDKLIYDIKTLIDHNLANEDFNLENASAQLFFSANYVRQIFKQKTGEGFTEYLIRCRMEKAEELLRDPANKIQDVAANTGYSSQRYFSSCFKKYYGCTPTEYREKETYHG